MTDRRIARRIRAVLQPAAVLGSVAALTGCLATGPVHERFEGPYVATVEPPAPREASFDTRAFNGPVSPDTLTQLSSGAWSIMDVPALEAYAEGILDDLLAVWARRHPDHEIPPIQVFFSSGSHFHASATKDGEIFVSLGALEKMTSEDELAFVLGHEAAHILLRHHDRQDFFAAFDESLNHAAALGAISLAASNADIRPDGQGGIAVSSGDDEQRQNATKGLAAYITVRELSGTVLSPAWSRDQEEYADLLGIDLMIGAGYDPGRVVELFSRRADDQRARLAELDAQADERSAEFERALNQAFTEGGVQGALEAGVEGILEIGGEAIDQMREDIGASHPDWEARRDAARLYAFSRYRDTVVDGPGATVGPYRAALSTPRTAAILANHRAAHAALAALNEDRIAEAARLGRQGISGATSDAPFTRYAMYLVRKYQGDLNSARLNLDRVRLDHRAPAIIYASLAHEYLAVDQPRRALGVLDRGAEQFSLRDPFLPEFILAHAANGSMANAEAAREECRQSDDSDLRRRCSLMWSRATGTGEGLFGLGSDFGEESLEDQATGGDGLPADGNSQDQGGGLGSMLDDLPFF